jgi:hypothetical protein
LSQAFARVSTFGRKYRLVVDGQHGVNSAGMQNLSFFRQPPIGTTARKRIRAHRSELLKPSMEIGGGECVRQTWDVED